MFALIRLRRPVTSEGCILGSTWRRFWSILLEPEKDFSQSEHTGGCNRILKDLELTVVALQRHLWLSIHLHILVRLVRLNPGVCMVHRHIIIDVKHNRQNRWGCKSTREKQRRIYTTIDSVSITQQYDCQVTPSIYVDVVSHESREGEGKRNSTLIFLNY